MTPIFPGLWGNNCEMKVWPGSTAWLCVVSGRDKGTKTPQTFAQDIPEPRPGGRGHRREPPGAPF